MNYIDLFDEDSILQHSLAFLAFKKYAAQTLDISASIAHVPNVIAIALLNKYDVLKQYNTYRQQLLNSNFTAAICNNELGYHGTDLEKITSCATLVNKNTYDVFINKPLITNVGDADLLIASVKEQHVNSSWLRIMLFVRQEVTQKNLSPDLLGMNNCCTGSISMEKCNYQHAKFLGSKRQSLFIMRTMYNLERFFIGAIVVGILEKILFLCAGLQGNNHHRLPSISDNQYLQDKIITIFKNKSTLEGLILKAISQYQSGEDYSDTLSLVKASAITDGHEAIMMFKEIVGGQAYIKKHVSNKLLHDHMAIYNLGGTKELMKITLFRELLKKYRKASDE